MLFVRLEWLRFTCSRFQRFPAESKTGRRFAGLTTRRRDLGRGSRFKWRTGICFAEGDRVASAVASCPLESQKMAFSKSLKAWTLQPRTVLRKANSLAR